MPPSSSSSSSLSLSSSLSTRDICFCVISVTLGAYCMLTDPSGLMASSEPLMAACSRTNVMTPEEHAATTGYQIYQPFWGFGIFKGLICFVTQFFYELLMTTTNNSPAGMIAWFTTCLISLPLSVLMTIEAGRKDAKGPIKYPMIMGIVFQLLGISIGFPLLWIPSWIVGRGSGGVNKRRIMICIPMVIVPTVVLSILIFTIHPMTFWWTNVAGILGGPAICLLNNAVYWTIPDPDPKDPKLFKDSNERSSMAFAFAGIVGLGCWMWLVFITAIPYYGFRGFFSSIYNDLWEQAPSDAVKFMTMDAVVLWLAGLIVLSYHNIFACLEGLALSLVFGPGAGLALVLAGLCVDDEAQLKVAEMTADAKKEAKMKAELGKKD